ncbi:MAG TPA: heavy metal translocating P-type ATPase, partial [Bacteroidia bacterium]|nr:heavy metal translocating P-type ATPase [Bacteroidia bacterium]
MEHQRIQLPIAGMSCASCAMNVESTLGSLPGVVKAGVNYASASALVEYLPSEISPVQMKTAVQSIGYDLLLETGPAAETAEDRNKREFRLLQFNAGGSSILAFPVLVIGMFFMDMPYANWIMMGLCLPVVTWFGRMFFVHAWKQARHAKANMDTLVALSTGIAFVFSCVNTLYPEFWMNRGVHPPVYFEASAVVIAIILLGKLMEEKARSQTSSSIKKLMGLQPDTVTRIAPGGEEQIIAVSLVLAGDLLLVKPGDKIPVDGDVVSGSSFVDESMISGEPVALEKISGSKVYAGTINQKGSFQMNAVKVGGDTVLAQIIRMVQEAQGSKAPVQKLADRIAGIFVPVVLGISILTFALWMFFGGAQAFTHAILAMVTVLVIACPCALGLATPTAIMVGVGKGAEHGILIRDAECLEKAQQADVLLLDKTGTITEGKPEVSDWLFSGGDASVREWKEILLGIESRSEHPLAEAVCNRLKAESIRAKQVEQVLSISGKGVEASWDGQMYWVGSPVFIAEQQIPSSPEQERLIRALQASAKTVICFARAGEVLAVIGITDTIKPGSAQAIQELQKSGMEVYMLTGDHALAAEAVAKIVGIREFRAGMMPADKAAFV